MAIDLSLCSTLPGKGPVKTGKFIVFEGIDGSGKTTQVGRFAARLQADGVPIHTTFEPTNGPVGAILRQYLVKRVSFDPRVLPYLYAADRGDHLYNDKNGIEQALARGITVICDRYILSSFAYQVPEHSFELVDYLNRSFRKPDLTIFLRRNPASALSEKQKQSNYSKDANDTLEKQTSVAAEYERAIAVFGDSHHVVTLDPLALGIEGTTDAIFERYEALR
jgi:dTMP kinase